MCPGASRLHQKAFCEQKGVDSLLIPFYTQTKTGITIIEDSNFSQKKSAGEDGLPLFLLYHWCVGRL